MRNVLLVALLAPIVALAAANLQPVTTIDVEQQVPYSENVSRVDGNGGPGGEPRALIGVVDTIGGTTYDWQANGPSYRMLVHSADLGIHALWMYSASDETTFPDRNMRYNFWDAGTGSWNWIDPDYMQSGVNVYTDRCGYGNLDADPATGVAMVTSHIGTPIHPDLARDMAPGAGIFEYATGAGTMDGYLWPFISVDANSKTHCHCIDDASRNMVYYSNVETWPTWASPVGVASPQPDPNFPNQNVAASKVSNKVCLTWEFSEGAPDPGFYRLSTDGGTSWENPEELPWPSAYTGDTSTSYHITSLFPYYDMMDNLHIIATVEPYVGGQGYIIPAQIWHWSPDQSPNWSHIHTAECAPENLGAAVGYNALYACRATCGEDSEGNLFVAWEQFDSANVEPGPPEVLRADIFAAGSGDGGMTWGDAVKLTEGGTGSHRFPSIIDMAFDLGTDEEYIGILYEIDLVAGFFVQNENIATNNPIIFHAVPTSEIPIPGGIAEGGRLNGRIQMTATPNPFARRANISYLLPRTTDVSVVVYDASGRPVRTLENSRRDAGRYTVSWDGRDASGSEVAAGIYFYTLTTDDSSLTDKLTVVR